MKRFALILLLALGACATRPDEERAVSPLLISTPQHRECWVIPASDVGFDPWANAMMECRR